MLTARLFSNKIAVIRAVAAYQSKIISFMLTGIKIFWLITKKTSGTQQLICRICTIFH